MALKGRRKNRRLRNAARIARGGRFNVKRLTPRRKARLEKRRRKFFEEDIDFDRVRRNNKKRALFSVIGRKGNKYETRILERHPEGRTIIDVMKIIKNNSNNG